MKNLIIPPNFTVRQTLKALNKGGEKSLIVVDEREMLLGVLSDGDLRRAILAGVQLNESIQNIYNPTPTFFVENEYNKKKVRQSFLEGKFDIIPVVDKEKIIVDVLLWEDVFKKEQNNKVNLSNVPIVIMAGGRGTRLEPFTKILPKPLIPLDDTPIIEHIIQRFTDVGCTDFHITLNYKSKLLKAYFEELKPNYKVHFVEENKPLGTAGSLRLLDGKFRQPFFVTNCDTIIKADYATLNEFHQKGGYDITLVASAKEYVIPYGTCKLNNDGHLDHINEKPKYDFLINTGMYVMNPKVLKLIPKNGFYHITHLIEDAKNRNKKVGVFPVDDDAWIDIGQWTEYKKVIESL
jgi:dTDP-glucose pyrophosphorylase